MKCQLKAGIKHQVVDHFVIRVIKQHFDNLGADDHIDWSVRSGILIGIQNRETFLVNVWKDVL